jgi:hypothetical protein
MKKEEYIKLVDKLIERIENERIEFIETSGVGYGEYEIRKNNKPVIYIRTNYTNGFSLGIDGNPLEYGLTSEQQNILKKIFDKLKELDKEWRANYTASLIEEFLND